MFKLANENPTTIFVVQCVHLDPLLTSKQVPAFWLVPEHIVILVSVHVECVQICSNWFEIRECALH